MVTARLSAVLSLNEVQESRETARSQPAADEEPGAWGARAGAGPKAEGRGPHRAYGQRAGHDPQGESSRELSLSWAMATPSGQSRPD